MTTHRVNASSNEEVDVVIVAKADAKRVKKWLQQQDVLSDTFRMCPSVQHPNAIAIPLRGDLPIGCPEEKSILARGIQCCPFKSSHFGSHTKSSEKVDRNSKTETISEVWQRRQAFNTIQNALFDVLSRVSEDSDQSTPSLAEEDLMDMISQLEKSLCPTKLQFLGDDHTLLLPERALLLRHDNHQDYSLSQLFQSVGIFGAQAQAHALSRVLACVAAECQSPRIVRYSRIHADSRIRECPMEILYPLYPTTTPGTTSHDNSSGPGSIEWITVTEHGIRQSYNMTRVMFSRGNVREKMRFGHDCVQPHDTVLDLYAGIGYFVLPALRLGGAARVVAVEWNPHAVEALEYNLQDNGIEKDRFTVYLGDCREVAQREGLVDMFDRVSLGLLPSSEGGWWTAVRALRRATGGWLHVHGNVPVKEQRQWYQWVCCSLRDLARMDGRVEWSVVGSHLEKVKSFAPTVNHYVADVWLGPATAPQWSSAKLEAGMAVLVDGDNVLVLDSDVPAPSCALSDDGPLHQEWMR